MAAIWGSLDGIEVDLRGRRWVRVKSALSGRTNIRIRALVGERTKVVRGIERVELSSLCAGEFVEVSYSRSRDGFMEAEIVYARADCGAVAISNEDHANDLWTY